MHGQSESVLWNRNASADPRIVSWTNLSGCRWMAAKITALPSAPKSRAPAVPQGLEQEAAKEELLHRRRHDDHEQARHDGQQSALVRAQLVGEVVLRRVDQLRVDTRQHQVDEERQHDQPTRRQKRKRRRPNIAASAGAASEAVIRQGRTTSAKSPAKVAMKVKARLSPRSLRAGHRKTTAMTIARPSGRAIATSTPSRPPEAASGQTGVHAAGGVQSGPRRSPEG